MAQPTPYLTNEPSRAEIDALKGPTLLDFGSPTCGHCRAAEPHTTAALASHADVRHIRVADGSGRPLGRSFGVKLWPTLIFLADGKEVGRLVRPVIEAPIREALQKLDPLRPAA